MTHDERRILKHALGITTEGAGYNSSSRNHFVTGPGSSDYKHCENLVAAGLMRKGERGQLVGGSYLYVVSEKGREALRKFLEQETALKTMVTEMAQTHYYMHGALINSIRIHWIDASTFDQQRMVVNKVEVQAEMAERASGPEFTCKFCGAPSWVDPSDQECPPDYCHPGDHGEQ